MGDKKAPVSGNNQLSISIRMIRAFYLDEDVWRHPEPQCPFCLRLSDTWEDVRRHIVEVHGHSVSERVH